MPSVGSSKTNNWGFPINALAIANCCCCPPLKSPPIRDNIVFKTGNNSKISSGISGFPFRPSGNASNPNNKFSFTVTRGITSRPWGT